MTAGSTLYQVTCVRSTAECADGHYRSFASGRFSWKMNGNMTSDIRSGFVAGTPVHTSSGLVPIEKVKTGDMVLSRREMTDEVIFRPVVKTLRREGMTIVAASFVVNAEGSTSYMLYPASGTCLLDLDKGWCRVDELATGTRFPLVDGRTAIALSRMPVYRTKQPEVGWYQKSEFNDQVGFTRGFRSGPVEVRASVPRDDDIFFSEAPRFPATVYDLELEEARSYFVGGPGVLAHVGNRTQLQLA